MTPKTYESLTHAAERTSVSDKTMMLRISDSSVIEIARPAVAAKVDAAAK